MTLAIDDEYYHFEGRPDENETTTEARQLPPPYPCDARYSLFHSAWSGPELVATVSCIASNCTKFVSHANVLLVIAGKNQVLYNYVMCFLQEYCCVKGGTYQPFISGLG